MDSSALTWRHLPSVKKRSALIVSYRTPLRLFRINCGLREWGTEGTVETISGKRRRTIEGIPGSEVRGIPDAPSGELLSFARKIAECTPPQKGVQCICLVLRGM